MNCCVSKRLMQKPARHCVCQFFRKEFSSQFWHSHDTSAEKGYSLEDSWPSQTFSKSGVERRIHEGKSRARIE